MENIQGGPIDDIHYTKRWYPEFISHVDGGRIEAAFRDQAIDYLFTFVILGIQL